VSYVIEDKQENEMRKDRERGKRTFGPLWIIANTFGWGTLIIVSRAAGWIEWEFYDNYGRDLFFRFRTFRFLPNGSIRMVIGLVIIGLCWGAIVGVLQQFVLRRRFELAGKRWVLVTVIGLTVYTTVEVLVPALAVSLAFRSYQILTGISTFVSPFAFGIAQWFLLRRYFTRSGWWIAATAIASWLSHFALSTFATGQLRSSVLIAFYLVQGLLYSVTTLIALTAIFRQSTVAVENE